MEPRPQWWGASAIITTPSLQTFSVSLTPRYLPRRAKHLIPRKELIYSRDLQSAYTVSGCLGIVSALLALTSMADACRGDTVVCMRKVMASSRG